MANKLEACFLDVTEALGRDLSKAEKARLKDSVNRAMTRAERAGEVDVDGAVRKILEEETRTIAAAAAVAKRNSALNAKLYMKELANFKNTWADDPESGLQALLGGSFTMRKGAGNSVAAGIASLQGNYIGTLTSKLAAQGLLDSKLWASTMGEHIWRAAHELGQPTPNLKGLPKEVVDIAKTILDVQEMARLNANGAGAWIGKLPGRLVRQSHDMVKLRRAGMEAWVSKISEQLDWDKTLPDVAVENRDRVLREMFTQLSSGVHVKMSAEPLTGLKGFGNVAKRFSHERVLHFKSPDAGFAYYKEFGSGNIMEDVVQELSGLARDTAIMRRLGPNAKMNLDRLVDGMMKKYRADNDAVRLKKIDETYKDLSRRLWPQLTGEVNIPGNAMLAEAAEGFRNLTRMAKLGGSVLSSLNDTVAYASTLKYAGADSFGGGFVNALESTFGSIGKEITPEQRRLAAQMGVMFDSVLSSNMLMDQEKPGAMSRLMGQYFKLNLQSPWTNGVRRGATRAVSMSHAESRGLGFGQLSKEMSGFLNRHDVSPAEWDIYRKGEVFDVGDGVKQLTPESIESLSPQSFDALIEDKTLQGKQLDKARENAKQSLQTKLRNLYFEVGALATTEPGANERAFLLRGTQAGTAEGELFRSFAQFKSFPVSIMRNHMGRFLHGYHPDRVSTPEAFKRLFTDRKNSGFGDMAQFVVGATMMGYASMVLKDLAKGKQPRVPTDPKSAYKILLAAAAQGGAGGIYGDFLFGESVSRFGHGPIETLLGPAAGDASDLYDLYTKMRNGDNAAASSFRFVLNHTPYYNLFYTRAAMDYAVAYRFQEWMNPGYLNRMQERLKTEKDQEFLLPPSEAIPFGGF